MGVPLPQLSEMRAAEHIFVSFSIGKSHKNPFTVRLERDLKSYFITFQICRCTNHVLPARAKLCYLCSLFTNIKYDHFLFARFHNWKQKIGAGPGLQGPKVLEGFRGELDIGFLGARGLFSGGLDLGLLCAGKVHLGGLDLRLVGAGRTCRTCKWWLGRLGLSRLDQI